MKQETISIFQIESENVSKKIEQATKDYKQSYLKIVELKKKYNRNPNENNYEYYNAYLEMLKCHYVLNQYETKRTLLFIKMIDVVIESCKNGGYCEIVTEGREVKQNLKNVKQRLKFILQHFKLKYDEAESIIKKYRKNQNLPMKDVQSFMQSAIFYNKLNDQLIRYEDETVKPNIEKANAWQQSIWDRLARQDLMIAKTQKGWEFIPIAEIEQIVE